MTKEMLLPHGFKRIGWSLFIAALLVFLLILMDAYFVFVPPHWYERSALISSVFSLLLGLGVPLVALSRERDEDEMIGQLRIKTVTQTAYIFLIVCCLWTLAYDLTNALTSTTGAHSQNIASQILNELAPAWTVSTLFIVYILIFQCRLWHLKYRSTKEE